MLAQVALGDIATWFAGIVCVVGLIGAGAWWMAATYGRVGSVGEKAEAIDKKLDTAMAEHKADRAEFWKAFTEQLKSHHALDIRVTRLEERRNEHREPCS